MLRKRFTVGNAMYLFMILGMILAVIMNLSINLIAEFAFEREEDFYLKLVSIFLFIGLSSLIIASRKFKAIIRVWSNDFPEKNNNKEDEEIILP